jgi:hypothetical protein
VVVELHCGNEFDGLEFSEEREADWDLVHLFAVFVGEDFKVAFVGIEG